MNFEKLLDRLSQGNTFEEIINSIDEEFVECVGNEVYEDNDLYDLLMRLGADIEDFGVGYAVIHTDEDKYYEVPYEVRSNRFDKDLPDETILIFNYKRIYDITSYRI